MADEHMKGIVNEDTVPTASDIQFHTGFQKTNPLARGDKNIKPLEVYAEHAEIRKQIHDEIKKLYVTLGPLGNRGLREDITIDRFLGCLSPLKQLHDLGRLPIYATSTRSTVPDKQKCMWALVSCLVQAYWEYELESPEKSKADIFILLGDLIKINEHYPEMKIAGAENKGYWLEL